MSDPFGIPLEHIAEAVGGKLHGIAEGAVCDHLLIDSRKPIPSPNTLFIALRGMRHDGHQHIADLIEQGVQHFLVEEVPRDLEEDVRFIEVDDTLTALQELGAWHRAMMDMPVVGITGSNGKTIVKEWLYNLIAPDGPVARSPGSWNSQVGVPLSLWTLREEHRIALIEAGISEPHEMQRLQAMIAPKLGIFTNIGTAHEKHFLEIGHKAAEKATLFKDCQVVITCIDDPVVVRALTELNGPEVVGWSRAEPDAFVRLKQQRTSAEHTDLEVEHVGGCFTVTIPFTDDAAVHNAMTCITFLLHRGMSSAVLAERIQKLPPVEMRLQLLEGMHGSTILNDAYSSDLVSLRIALDRLQAVGTGKERIAVLGGIEQSATNDEALILEMEKLCANAGVKTIHGIGLEWIRGKPGDHTICYANTEEFLERFDREDFREAAVLVKGARSYHLEEVVHRLQRRIHSTVLEIDLNAIRHNLNAHRAKLRPGTKVMAMVKAFGYGGGSPELARALEFERVDLLGVAYVDEGIVLRNEGISTPIMVMDPEHADHATLERYDLQPEVYSMEQLKAAIAHSNSSGTPVRIHLKLDSGMHRLGFLATELSEVKDLLQATDALHVASVFSHLAGSDDPTMDAFTQQQFHTFTQMADELEEVLAYTPMRHILNSAGIARFPEMHLDMVRLGIGMFGINGYAAMQQELVPACTLRSSISQIKEIVPGDQVGYAGAFTATQPMRIAIVPLGYADGIRRTLGNGHVSFRVNGSHAATIGNICMDMCMLDITEVDCTVGDPVVVFGPDDPLQRIAEALDTIPYEVLASISQRVKRVYTEE